MTPEQHRTGLAILLAVSETIRETSPAPAGVLYAALMQHGCTYEQFTSLVQTLKNAGLVTEKNHELTWVGPKIAPSNKS